MYSTRLVKRDHLIVVLAAAGLVVGWCARGAAAQADAESVQRLERQLRQLDQDYRLVTDPDAPIAERALIDAGASIRFGYYSIDNQESEAHELRQTDGRLYLRADLDGAHRVFARLRFLYNDWNDGESFDGRGDQLEHSLGDEYWYQFDYRSAVLAGRGVDPGWNANIKVGRQWVHWAEGVSLSLPLYAVLADFEFGGGVALTGLAGMTPQETVIDFDGTRPGFDTETDRLFWGAMLEWRNPGSHSPFAYILSQTDRNDQDEFTFVGDGGTLYPTEFEYDSVYVGFGSRGPIDSDLFYHLEVVHEFGSGKSSTFDPETGNPLPQTDEDISAWAAVFGLTYVPRDEGESRFEFEVIAATGDDDRVDAGDTFGGNLPGTDDNSFNSFGFLNTGLALGPDPANLLSLRFGASTKPLLATDLFDDLRFGIDAFLFHKLDDDAPLNVGTTRNSYVGSEIDLALDWRITSDVTATLRYALFFPGEAMPDQEDDIRQFFFAGVTYAF